MGALKVALLGTFEARLPSGAAVRFPRKKSEALLAYLAFHPGRMQARDKLAALLWGDAPDERARHSLRQALVTLRRALHRAAALCLVEEGDTVGVSPDGVEVDVAVFEGLMKDGSPEALEHAAALYRGDLLEGVSVDEPPFEEWLRAERERLRELAVEGLAKLLGHLARTGAVDRAVQTAVRLLGLDPAQEPVHRTLMRLYARQGRRGAALRQYQACVEALERELGVEPEAETRQLYRELLQTRPRAARVEGPRRRPTPMPTPGTTLVGRGVELDTLRQRLGDARRGRGAIGLIQGEAGIGKTRLLEALVADAIEGGGQVLAGRGYESEQVLPLGPWVDAFRAGQVVPGAIEELDEQWRAELARLFPELGRPEREPAAAEDYVRLFEAMARAVQHLASPSPLVVVLEDLHWADEMTLRLLVFLGRRMVDWPVLVVGTLRVEEVVDVPVLRRTIAQLGRQPRFFSATLGPLSEAETVTLVRTLMRAGTEEATLQRFGEKVWRASEGNPFMVLETVRALQRVDGMDVEGEVLTPPRVRELIGSRLERLSERGRRLAAVASVIGREFDFALLERAAELSATDTAESVDELVARRILHVVGERLDFTHERIREIAYEGLLAPYRRRLHEATARALEGLHEADPAPHALALGRHYYAGEVWDRACGYLARAGTDAAARAAHREAVACFEQTLDALRHLPVSRATTERAIDLRFELRQSCVPLLDHRRLLEHLREAEAEAEAIGDRTRLGWALVYRAHGLLLSGDFAGAIDAGQRGLAIGEALADPGLAESANFYLGQILHWVGDYRRGAALLRQSAALEDAVARQGMKSKQVVNSRTFLGWCLAELGEFPEAMECTSETVALAEAAGNAYWLVHACCGVGLVHLRRGDFAEARAVAERAVELCRGRDFTALWAISAAILGSAYTGLGQAAEAIQFLEQAAEVAASHGAPVLGFLGEAYVLAGRPNEAAAVAKRALALALERAERGWQAWILRLQGDIAAGLETPDIARAEEAYRRALGLADELGMRPLVARCRLGLGGLLRRAGSRPEALEHLTAAAAMFDEMGMTSWRDRVEVERHLVNRSS
jgi:DNA-binding SARP family transcriptional activator/tetratricopeptide (TPR) repeat protein